jgi:hypothetical protein
MPCRLPSGRRPSAPLTWGEKPRRKGGQGTCDRRQPSELTLPVCTADQGQVGKHALPQLVSPYEHARHSLDQVERLMPARHPPSGATAVLGFFGGSRWE